MAGGHFNLNQAAKAITNTASSAASTALELANPLPKPAEGRTRGDQFRTITRQIGSTVKETGKAVEKAGDVLSEGSQIVGYAAAAGEVAGMGLTVLGAPEFGVPLMAASEAVGTSDALMAAGIGAPALQNMGAWMVDSGSTMRNMAKGAEKGVRQEHAAQLAVTAAGYQYRDNMHLGPPEVPNMSMDAQFSGDRRAMVYTHDNDNSVYITYNGTDFSNVDDVKADAYIVAGEESKSAHFKYADKLFKQVQAKYPDKEIHITAIHSVAPLRPTSDAGTKPPRSHLTAAAS